MGWFNEAEIPYSVVLTKADRVSLPQIVRFANEACMPYHSQLYQGHGSQGPVVHITSSSKKEALKS
jgi:GTP-binding protein EngB required for normal cell division